MTDQIQTRLDQLRDELTVLQNGAQYLVITEKILLLKGEIKGLEWVLINIFKG
jgi:hypothetical protein